MFEQRRFWRGRGRSLNISAPLPVPAGFLTVLGNDHICTLLDQYWNSYSLRLPWINPRLEVHMLSFLFPLMSHWVQINPILRFLNIICVDCASEFTCFEMTLFFFFFLLDYQQSLSDVAKANFCSSAWIYPECYWSSCTNTPQAGSVQSSQPITQLKGLFYFIFLIFCIHSVRDGNVCVQHCVRGYAIWIGLGGGGLPEDILSFIALAINR